MNDWRKTSGRLSALLSQMHGQMMLLLDALQDTDLTPYQQSICNTARKRLYRSRTELLREYGELNDPEEDL